MGNQSEKKQFYAPEQKTVRVQSLTQAYHQELANVEADKIIFLDETGCVLNRTCAYGRAPTCERVYGEKKTVHSPRVSTIGTLSSSGIESAMSFEGTLNTQVLLTFIELFLKTSIKPGQVLVMDNAPVHKAQPVVDALNKLNIKVVYLPPYSPHLNPIEHAWSVLKTFLRSVALPTKDDFYHFIGKGINKISKIQVNAFFGHVDLCV